MSHTAADEAVIELAAADGARLTIRLKGAGLDVAALVSAFRGGHDPDHPQMRVLVAVEPVDFRRGIDGLSQVCRAALSADPMDGTMFVFRWHSAKSIKLLVYDGQGF